MFKIPKINNINCSYSVNKTVQQPASNTEQTVSNPVKTNIPENDLKNVSFSDVQAYIPSFTRIGRTKQTNDTDQVPSTEQKIQVIQSKLDKQALTAFSRLNQNGILFDTSSNDGSSVLDNLYNIATKKRIPGLNDGQIMSEVVKALDNPFTITQKFGDIPQNVANEIARETGKQFPTVAYNVISSCCVVASMEFNLAQKKPAEFARFAEGLSGETYSVDKNIKMSDISDGTVDAIWKLKEFNTTSEIKDWDNVTVKIHPDRNAIVRARVQSSYQDPGERSCVDVLIQSALLNLGSQNSYDALTDERTGKFNPDKTGLTNEEKNFVEEIVFEAPKVSVVYQNLDENGHLAGYNATADETKQHIIKSLQLGQNVIIGYTHLDSNNNVNGGHEITIIGYRTDKDNKIHFICNDTDDNLDKPIEYSEDKLIPLIHHADIPKEALSENDEIEESWRGFLNEFKNILR